MLSATAMPTQADAGRWGGRLARSLRLRHDAPAAGMIHVVRIATNGPKRAAGRLSDQTLGARGRPEAGPRCLERPCGWRREMRVRFEGRRLRLSRMGVVRYAAGEVRFARGGDRAGVTTSSLRQQAYAS